MGVTKVNVAQIISMVERGQPVNPYSIPPLMIIWQLNSLLPPARLILAYFVHVDRSYEARSFKGPFLKVKLACGFLDFPECHAFKIAVMS
jgi:hypothetical protein